MCDNIMADTMDNSSHMEYLIHLKVESHTEVCYLQRTKSCEKQRAVYKLLWEHGSEK